MTPPRNAVQRRGGGRFYPYPLHASEDEQKQYPSSTSATSMWPKPWAMPWASKMAAERAIELHKSGGLEALLQQDDKVALDAIKGAFRHARDDAAIQGSKVHEAWEEYLKDRSRLDAIRKGLPELALLMFDGIMELTLKYNVEWERSEQTAYNHDHEYAGTFDGIVTMDTPNGRRRLLVDIKTSKGATRDEYAAQLSSYRHATHIIHDDGTEEPMPSVGMRNLSRATGRGARDSREHRRRGVRWVPRLLANAPSEQERQATFLASTSGARGRDRRQVEWVSVMSSWPLCRQRRVPRLAAAPTSSLTTRVTSWQAP